MPDFSGNFLIWITIGFYNIALCVQVKILPGLVITMQSTDKAYFSIYSIRELFILRKTKGFSILTQYLLNMVSFLLKFWLKMKIKIFLVEALLKHTFNLDEIWIRSSIFVMGILKYLEHSFILKVFEFNILNGKYSDWSDSERERRKSYHNFLVAYSNSSISGGSSLSHWVTSQFNMRK